MKKIIFFGVLVVISAAFLSSDVLGKKKVTFLMKLAECRDEYNKRNEKWVIHDLTCNRIPTKGEYVGVSWYWRGQEPRLNQEWMADSGKVIKFSNFYNAKRQNIGHWCPETVKKYKLLCKVD